MKRRARAEEDKEQRREDILNAAAALIADRDYSSVTMSQIAQKTGLAKGTLYLYFNTKEEVFLELFTVSVKEWLGELSSILRAMTPPIQDEQLARLLAATLLHRPVLPRLLALLNGVLERNITEEAGRKFKKNLIVSMLDVGEALEQSLPQFGPGDGLRFQLIADSLIVGLYEMSTPSQTIENVLEELGLQFFKIDFETEFIHAITALLRGWPQQGQSH